ncbi:flavodoxin family protein [Kineosporia succinea]|uniref:Flavorubredoxin n=1 Tax=Kineosporia succinea TaxID=84632 RepID=A0ABT9PE83_9ACTN|nr:flavodoxin domain-containing protein [Kineosporia succinea]MDP9831022.1 flavorubredoxin [Kineosporia succinea]
MNVLIVIETCFGNTQRFAEAIASGLVRRGAAVTVVKAADVRPDALNEVDLLIVGAPTHNRGLPGPASRRMAQTQGAGATGPGVAEWLDVMPEYHGRAAAFDSVSGTGFINGSAAKKIVKRLQRNLVEVADSESFVVGAAEGPPLDGELERAEKFGTSLA